MRITTAMLADDAVALEGKVYIHGGGWDTMFVPEFPSLVARIALVFTVEIEPTEFQQPHTLTVRLVDQDHQPYQSIQASTLIQSAPGPFSTPGASAYSTQVWRMEKFQIDRAGSFRFLIERDDEILAQVPLTVQVVPQMPTADS